LTSIALILPITNRRCPGQAKKAALSDLLTHYAYATTLLPAKTGVIHFRTLECPIYRIHPAVTTAGQPVPQTHRAPILVNGETVYAARAQMRIGDRPALRPDFASARLRAQIQKTISLCAKFYAGRGSLDLRICLSLHHRRGQSNRTSRNKGDPGQGFHNHDRAAPF
jgi:hypothetical protein